MESKRANHIRILSRWRIYVREDIAVGPGKIELLTHIKETGSILEAAKKMKMSYMRAWLLLKTMNRYFKEPVVTATRGGKEGGGARLTATGESVLSLYQTLESESIAATDKTRRALTTLFKP